MKPTLLTIVFLLAFGVSALHASGTKYHSEDLPDPGGYNAHFPDMDGNGDGRVAWEEFQAYFPEAERKVFDAVDSNRDAGLDHEEWHEFKAAHGLKHAD
jgi:hypothetical protein